MIFNYIVTFENLSDISEIDILKGSVVKIKNSQIKGESQNL